MLEQGLGSRPTGSSLQGAVSEQRRALLVYDLCLADCTVTSTSELVSSGEVKIAEGHHRRLSYGTEHMPSTAC